MHFFRSCVGKPGVAPLINRYITVLPEASRLVAALHATPFVDSTIFTLVLRGNPPIDAGPNCFIPNMAS